MPDDGFPVPEGEIGQPADKEQGRKPRRKGQTAKQKAASQANMAKAREANRAKSKAGLVSEVERSVGEGLTKGGALLTPVLPVPGGYLIMTAEDVAGVVSRIASNNPKLLAKLSKATDIMDYVSLGYWAVGLGVSVAVQFERMSVDSQIAEQFGVTALVDQMVDEIRREPEVSDNGHGDEEGARSSIVGTGPIGAGSDVAPG